MREDFLLEIWGEDLNLFAYKNSIGMALESRFEMYHQRLDIIFGPKIWRFQDEQDFPI